MPPSSTLSACLFARIDQWAQEVVTHTEQHKQRRTGSSGHGMRLRSLPARQGLTEISINPHSRKRKATAAMEDPNKTGAGKKAKIGSGPPKQRGRPPGLKNKSKQVIENEENGDDEVYSPATLPSRRKLPSSVPDLPPPSDSSAKPGSPLRSGVSPSKKEKKGVFVLDRAKSEAAIDMAYLETCTPPAKQVTIPELNAMGKPIHPAVLSLFNKLTKVPTGCIPSELKASIQQEANTPRKSKVEIHDSQYLPDSGTPYPPQYLNRLKTTVGMVFDKAAEAHKTGAHERQWGACLTQLLCEVELWGKESGVIELNVETCSIQPDVMRPTRPEGAGYIDLEVISNNSRATAAESLSRMVDRCLGFKLSFDHKARILRAWRKLYDNEFSLNQSISYINSNLIFVDFEVKKKVAGSRDPLVQLTIWEMAWLLKRQHHDWDTSMPMPGIAINGHSWECYLFFEMDGELIVAGPITFGNTVDLPGIWQILYRLYILMEWGRTEYIAWFKEHIIEGWADNVM